MLKFWQLKPSLVKKIASFLYISGILILFFSLFDIRGDLQKIKTKKIKVNTVILIDTSLSMAVEDVAPNRFKRSIFLARHLIKKIPNNEIALMVFSDDVKILSPFTHDIDFLDTKLKSLKEIDILNGGTRINRAIFSADSYLQQFSDVGNIIILSDGEVHFKNIAKRKIKASLYFIAVGTFSGGLIPIRNKGGKLLYYKKNKGKKIRSQLNKGFINKMKSSYKKFKYYIPLNFGVPSEEIAQSINSIHIKSTIESDENTRPVIGIKFILVAFVFLFISFFLNLGKTYLYQSIICFFFFMSSNSYSKDTIELINLKSGDYNYKDLNLLARKLVLEKKYKKTVIIYKEILNLNSEFEKNYYFLNNLGLSQGLSGQFVLGLNKLVLSSYNVSQDSKDKVYRNILSILSRKQSKRKKTKKKRGGDKKKNGKKNKTTKPKKGKQGSSDKNEKIFGNKRKRTKREKQNIKRKRAKMNEIVNLIKDMDKQMQKKYLKTNHSKKRYGGRFDW